MIIKRSRNVIIGGRFITAIGNYSNDKIATLNTEAFVAKTLGRLNSCTGSLLSRRPAVHATVSPTTDHVNWTYARHSLLYMKVRRCRQA